MSQTETVLLVILGFAIASLLALFIGRFAWNTALRLGAKRMQRQVPSTVAELQSERDRLRAEYAMLSQRLGNKLEVIKAKMAEQMAEVTRHRNRLEVLRADLATSENRVTGLQQEIEQKKVIEAALRTDISELRAELGHRDQKISTLDSELLQAAIRESAAQERLRQRISELTSMSQQIASNRQQYVVRDEEFPAAPLPAAQLSVPAGPPLDETFAAAERETLELERELALLDESWGEKLAEIEKKREAAPDNIIALSNRVRQQQ